MDSVQYFRNCFSFEVPLFVKFIYGIQTDKYGKEVKWNKVKHQPVLF